MNRFALLLLMSTALMAQTAPEQTKPTEMVKGPRVDVVSPSALRPGNSYTLDLQGKNLSPETAISFGKNITIVGVPVITSPTEANVTIIVSLAAPPGVIPVLAEDSTGANSGPGGVIIGVASTTPEIILDLPRDTREPMMLGEKTLFSWHESSPGTANFFVYELIDDDSNVVFAAQTTKPFFRISAADLTVMPSGTSSKKIRWRVRGMKNPGDANEVETSSERAIRLPPHH